MISTPRRRFRRLAAAVAGAALIAGALDGRARRTPHHRERSIRSTRTSAPTSDLQPRHSPGRDPDARSTRSPTSSATTRWAPAATPSTSCPVTTAPPRPRCSSRSATTPRSPASARRPTTSRSTARSRSTTAASPTAARRTASRSSTSGARSRTSRCRSTRRARTDAVSSANFWAVSQAVSMRRVDVSGGNLSLMDYCTAGPQFASGGFIADSRAADTINGSQQQWLTRNSEVAGWTQRRLEPGLLGRRRRPRRRRLPGPAVHDDRRDAGQPREAVPLRRRQRRVQRARAVGPDEHERHLVGRRRDGGAQHPDHGVLHRDAGRLGQGHQQRARARPAPDPHAGRVRHRPHDRGQAGRHGRARHGPRDAHGGGRRGSARGRRMPRASSSPESPSTRAPRSRPCC